MLHVCQCRRALSTSAAKTQATTAIVREHPRCPLLPSHGRATPKSFEPRRKFVEKQLNEWRRGFARQNSLPFDGPRTLIEGTGGFYLMAHPYYLPVKRQSTVTTLRTFWAKMKLQNDQYKQLFKSAVQAAPAKYIKTIRHMQDDEWPQLTESGLMSADSGLVESLSSAWSDLSTEQRRLLNVRRQDVIGQPGLHSYLLPQHKWPHAWMCAMRLVDSGDGGQTAVQMDFLIESAHRLSALKECWPEPDPQVYGYGLPRFVIGNVRLQRLLFASPDQWNDWTVVGFNQIVLP